MLVNMSQSVESQDVEDAPHGTADDDSASDAPFEPLTAAYERLRHSHDVQELSAFARRTLPDSSDQSAFSRATALLEAVAGNPNTPLADRVLLARTMPFPNVLVKLSADADEEVRIAVAANTSDKNWLVGRLTKDVSTKVRDVALRNPQTSWKMRLEGAQNPQTGADTLDFLSRLGTEMEPQAPQVLAVMVRHAVALNSSTAVQTRQRLLNDPVPEVANAAQEGLS